MAAAAAWTVAAESAAEVWWRIAISADVGQPRLPAQGKGRWGGGEVRRC